MNQTILKLQMFQRSVLREINGKSRKLPIILNCLNVNNFRLWIFKIVKVITFFLYVCVCTCLCKCVCVLFKSFQDAIELEYLFVAQFQFPNFYFSSFGLLSPGIVLIQWWTDCQNNVQVRLPQKPVGVVSLTSVDLGTNDM